MGDGLVVGGEGTTRAARSYDQRCWRGRGKDWFSILSMMSIELPFACLSCFSRTFIVFLMFFNDFL